MGILLIVLVVFALTGITAAIWGFLRPPRDDRPGGRAEGPSQDGPPKKKEKEP